jgi:hypothetical protein
VLLARRELVDQRGLADPSLTADQHQPSATGPSLGEPSPEGVERGFPLPCSGVTVGAILTPFGRAASPWKGER